MIGRYAIVLLVPLLLAGCSLHSPVGTEDSALQGRGQFTFRNGDGPPIRVFYAGSGNDLAHAQIIFVLHGVNRNASDYRDAWVPLAQGRDVIVVAPEFNEEDFPESRGYNLGGMQSGSKQSSGAFDYIEPLFTEVVRRIGGNQTGYDMFGHSAGAQFVHRFVEFAEAPRLQTAIAANAGWYTLPETDVAFPYGMQDAPIEPEASRYLRRDLLVLLGAEDTDGENMRKTEQALEQGPTRVERGMNFYGSALKAAQSSDVKLAWRLEIVPEIGHDYADMSWAAAQRLINP